MITQQHDTLKQVLSHSPLDQTEAETPSSAVSSQFGHLQLPLPLHEMTYLSVDAKHEAKPLTTKTWTALATIEHNPIAREDVEDVEMLKRWQMYNLLLKTSQRVTGLEVTQQLDQVASGSNLNGTQAAQLLKFKEWLTWWCQTNHQL